MNWAYTTSLYEAYTAEGRRYHSKEAAVYRAHGPATSWRLIRLKSNQPLNIVDGCDWETLTAGGAIAVSRKEA